jgi:uncharacterized protein with FMN-binding domain
MKAIGSILMCVLIAGCLGSGAITESGFAPGVYEGTGQGYRGPVRVQVQVSPAGIEDIVIISHDEGNYSGLPAMEELLDLVLTEGTTDLDAISGATYSSRGFLEAVEDALERAHREANGTSPQDEPTGESEDELIAEPMD